MAAKGPVLSNTEGAGTQLELAGAKKEEAKEPAEAGETAVSVAETESGTAQMEAASLLTTVTSFPRRVWQWLLQYSLLNLSAYLFVNEGNYEAMEKFFAMMVLMNALVYAMSSAMASAVSFEELEFWYDECQRSAELRKCVDRMNGGNGKDVCSQPIRKFQNMITISHQLLAFSLFVSALMYLYVMAFMQKREDESDESEDDESKEPPSVERLAVDKKRHETWRLFSKTAVFLTVLTVTAIVFYQMAYNYMTAFKFMVFAWRKGEHCNSHNVRATSTHIGVNLLAIGLAVICSWVSFSLGRIHGLPQ